jgi:anti-sigma factor RsiW
MTRTPASRRIRSKQGKEVCQQITDLLVEYVTGTLPPATAADFEQHLSICPDCVAFLNTYRKTMELTRSLRYESLPPEMKRRMLQFIESRTKKRRRGR